MKICLGCSELIESGSRCRACQLPRTPQTSATRRGYPSWWARLSTAARIRQPWCTDCLTPGAAGNPLSLDHTPRSWAKVTEGKRLTLRDCANGLAVVRCLRCNIAAGPARGANVTRTD